MCVFVSVYACVYVEVEVVVGWWGGELTLLPSGFEVEDADEHSRMI